ncbi:hypothetical protein KL930_003204 [Ogataea haglerorum]|uniref:Uncharacterized protein n=1 Tax=Ogataea haglerorum TaxID=1937702 RepID=A0AAN6HZ37_9ASCO|nr:uncharacterized protein KL911_002545 [Ogataea haglerorum]KAG7696177.1 hypothetical protein KL915_002541 [Ogataea haglerorum]KAG7708686.1 hypothetical protein KL950_002206 [Ogataea haglerorum]KAG7716180.1 hypothetical protein KL913_003391 [Ogataea haglerorum]KAG7717119.1 hypothetical protein KL949_003715 [Ogataea haglerorum]KAG7725835.1 hypothetical protein KL933_003883 [Ogataea haglerorum]
MFQAEDLFCTAGLGQRARYTAGKPVGARDGWAPMCQSGWGQSSHSGTNTPQWQAADGIGISMGTIARLMTCDDGKVAVYGARWWEEWIETQPHIGGFYSFEELPSAEPRNSSCASGKLLNRTVNGTLDCPNSAILLGRIEFPGRSLLSHAS